MDSEQIGQIIKGLDEAVSKIDDMRDDIGLVRDIVSERAFVEYDDIAELEELTDEYQGDLISYPVAILLEKLALELREELANRPEQDPTTT